MAINLAQWISPAFDDAIREVFDRIDGKIVIYDSQVEQKSENQSPVVTVETTPEIQSFLSTLKAEDGTPLF